jgi:hypothetical protein
VRLCLLFIVSNIGAALISLSNAKINDLVLTKGMHEGFVWWVVL